MSGKTSRKVIVDIIPTPVISSSNTIPAIKGSTSNSDTPSFKAFSESIAARKEKLVQAKRHAPVINVAGSKDEIKELIPEIIEEEDKDGRILQVSFITDRGKESLN